MQYHNISIVKKDTLETKCFCFDKQDKQLDIDNSYNNVNLKYCKEFERKHIKGAKGYWDYDLFIKKETTYKFITEYSKIDNTNYWLMKKYKDNVVISENKIKLTDNIIATRKSYTEHISSKNATQTIRHLMKTEIIN